MEVLTYRETFDTADRADITGYAGWVARSAETMRVERQAATSAVGAGISIARQETSWLAADEIEGELRLVVSGTTGTKRAILSMGSGHASTPTIGFAVRVSEAVGVWSIDRAANPTQNADVASWQPVATLFPVQDNGSHVNVVQGIRVRWKVVLGGVRVMVWWNQAGDTAPALDYTYKEGWPTGLTATRGYLLLGVDLSGAVSDLCVLGLEVEAKTPAADREERVGEYATVPEIISRAVNKFEGHRQAASFPSDRLLALLQEAQDDLLTRLGNIAWFRRRVEQLTITADNYGLVTLPLSVSNVHSITTDYGAELVWTLVGIATDGRTQVRLTPRYSSNVTLTYEPRRERLVANGNVAIPREIDGALVDKLASLMADSHASFEDKQARNMRAEASIASAVTYCQQRMQPVRLTITPLGTSLRSKRHQPYYGGW